MSRGWTGSNRRSTLPPDWPARRRAVLTRDAFACQLRRPDRCTGRATDVDHVSGHDDSLGNLQALCGACHLWKTGVDTAAARPSRRRTAPRHPGLHGEPAGGVGRDTGGGPHDIARSYTG